jgi:hypothetical protein
VPDFVEECGRRYPFDIVLTILHISLRESGWFFKLPGKERLAWHGTGISGVCDASVFEQFYRRQQ